MATVYVSPAGSNTSPYDTWAKAANLPATAQTYLNGRASSGHTMYIGPGTYNSNLQLDDGDALNESVLGVNAFGVATGAYYPAGPGDVVLNVPSGSSGFLAMQSGITVKDIRITGGSSDKHAFFVTGANFTAENISSVLFLGQGFTTWTGATGYSVKNLFVRSAALVGVQYVYLAQNSAGTINNLIIDSDASFIPASAPNGILHSSSGTTVINNAAIFPGRGIGVYVTAGSLIINNSILGACYYPDVYVARRDSGALTLNNCVIGMSFPGGEHRQLSGTITTNNCITNVFRTIKRHKNTGFIIPAVDDGASLAHALVVEAELAKKGMRGTYYVEASNFAANMDALRAMSQRGVFEIACHAYSHSSLALTGAAWSITKAGHTINVDRASDTITVDGASPVVVTGFRAKTLLAIRTELAAGGCTNGAMTTNLSSATLGESLADSAGAQASPYSPTLLIDATGATGFWKVEVVDAKAIADAEMGAPVVSFGPPYGQSTQALEDLVKSVGFTNQRNAQDTLNYLLRSIDLYKWNFISSTRFINADAQTSRNRTHSIAQAMAQGGGVVCLLTHNGEATGEHWAVVLDALSKYPELQITTAGDFANQVMTSGDWVESNVHCTASGEPYAGCTGAGTGRCWVRTETNGDDYHLLKGSPCIRAGVDVGLTTDADGVTIPAGAGFDIGPYFYKPEVTSGFSPWCKCDSAMPLSAQPCKSHALPIGTGKITIFDGIASAGQIEEAL